MADKMKYQPPMIIDLSKKSARGEIDGVCTAGLFPYEFCSEGEHYGVSTNCIGTGNRPAGAGSGCTDGFDPTGNECSGWGSSADNSCNGGWRA